MQDHGGVTAHSPHAFPIRLFLTSPHECGYYPEREARSVVLDPASPFLAQIYPDAIDYGFRRSGAQVYRPHCANCKACIATRIRVAEFSPDRSQRRCMSRNTDLRVEVAQARCCREYFDLYSRYLDARHGDGPMAQASIEDFEQFLLSAWCHTQFIELRHDNVLVGLAVTDVLPQGLSAVYTFYDPDLTKRSLGTFAILQQIAAAAQRQLPFVYLGYWLDGHPKMDYKRRFSGLEVLRDGHWQTLA